ncbi:hypothetical protein CFC21_096601 [Triticum aestivum]|uniref:Uncharacterized protein n=2 Tax=Triticum aestivum TaxID=4565 RepID=A0A3B6RAU3_WHEAT|nr:uncharacterized protein LOC119330924 [Triticum dicoccoides]XP_044426258.1 uncharacterized protein LOC123150477 [Triticum aestivum]KAF7094280.1 hypothetical protein CFC21_096601 [Triticum aestivum]
MDILEQPLEAVAFRIHSLPEPAAAWTCLAAVLAAAAAAGVWRLRSSTPSSTVITEGSSKPLVDLDTSPLLVPAETERSLGSWRSCEATSSSSLPALSPRERYTAYYHDSGCVGCCDVESDDEEAEEDRDPEDDYGVYGPAEMDPFEWEVVRPLVPLMPATAAETGRYLSPRALSGSVVRLWDQGADRSFMTAAASRRRMGRAGTVSSF